MKQPGAPTPLPSSFILCISLHSGGRLAPASPDWAPGLRAAPAPGSRGGRGSGAGWGRAGSRLLRLQPREGILGAAPPPHVRAAQGPVPPA